MTLLLDLGYLALTAKFIPQKVSRHSARQLFLYSIIYLSLLFIMVFADCRCG